VADLLPSELMHAPTTAADWPTFVSCLERALDAYDLDPSTFGDDARQPTQLFLDAPVSPLPPALRDHAAALQARIDAITAHLQLEMDRLFIRLTAGTDDHRGDGPAVYIDEKF
jgi:hypothetical protein